MNREDLDRMVSEAAEEEPGRRVMPCARAFELSRKYSVTVSEIGESCNREGIKIVRCQLGCF